MRCVCVRWLCVLTHSARSGEVSALHHALSHLAAEQANTHTLQVLRGELQTHSMTLELCGGEEEQAFHFCAPASCG